MFTDININPINNKTDHISEEYIFYRKKSKTNVSIFTDQGPDPDPLFHESVISRNGSEDPEHWL